MISSAFRNIRRLADQIKHSRRHVSVTSLYLAERVFSIALSFATYIVFARSYGPALLGTYSYVQTVMQFALPFLAAGSEPIVIRELVRRTRSHGEVMGSAFIVLTATGLIVTLLPLGFVLVMQHSDRLVWTLAIIVAVGFLPNGFLVADHALKAEVRALPVVVTRGISTLVSACARLFVILHGYLNQPLSLPSLPPRPLC